MKQWKTYGAALALALCLTGMAGCGQTSADSSSDGSYSTSAILMHPVYRLTSMAEQLQTVGDDLADPMTYEEILAENDEEVRDDINDLHTAGTELQTSLQSTDYAADFWESHPNCKAYLTAAADYCAQSDFTDESQLIQMTQPLLDLKTEQAKHYEDMQFYDLLEDALNGYDYGA